MLVNQALQVIPCATELLMPEAVLPTGGSRNVVPFGINKAFTDNDQAVLLILEDFSHIIEELVGFKGNLREVDQVRRIFRIVTALGQSRTSSDPTG